MHIPTFALPVKGLSLTEPWRIKFLVASWIIDMMFSMQENVQMARIFILILFLYCRRWTN
jgi:hypothetical protein